MLEEIFDCSSFEDNIENSKQIACKTHNMVFFKWLVDEELAKNSIFFFELNRSIEASRDCEIGMQMLIEVKILAFAHFF